MAAALGSSLGLVAETFAGAGFVPETEPIGDDRWLGRHPAFTAVLEGDPVAMITLTASPSPAFGKLIGVVCDMATPGDAEEFRTWTQRTMRGWAKRLGKRGAHLDAVLETKRSKMQLRSIGRQLIAVTWSRR